MRLLEVPWWLGSEGLGSLGSFFLLLLYLEFTWLVAASVSVLVFVLLDKCTREQLLKIADH